MYLQKGVVVKASRKQGKKNQTGGFGFSGGLQFGGFGFSGGMKFGMGRKQRGGKSIRVSRANLVY